MYFTQYSDLNDQNSEVRASDECKHDVRIEPRDNSGRENKSTGYRTLW